MRWTLSNGITVIAKQTDFRNDELLFSAHSPGGRSLVADGDYVSALYAAGLVAGSGAGLHDSVTLNKLLAGKRVSVSPYIGELFEGLGGSASPEDLETLFQLVTLYATEPRFDAAHFSTVEARLRSVAETRGSQPDAVLYDTVGSVLNQHHFRYRPLTLVVDQIRANILTESNIRDLVRLVGEELDGVAREQHQKLETIESELADVRRRLDRLYHLMETTELDISDVLPRVREHKERSERLEQAASEARAGLSERRAVLDDVDTITAYAEDMSEFLATSELTESKAFIRSFVKEIAVAPGAATIRYTIPMPGDSPLGGSEAEEVALGGPVLSTVKSGGRYWIRTSDLCDVNAAL